MTNNEIINHPDSHAFSRLASFEAANKVLTELLSCAPGCFGAIKEDPEAIKFPFVVIVLDGEDAA